MSTLLIDELRTSLEQDFSVTSRNEVAAIRPRLYFQNDPTGTFTISIYEGVTLLGSSSLTMTEILANTGWSAGQYHYGRIRFSFDLPVILQHGVSYTIKLTSSGYTFSEASYLGWCKSWDNLINTFVDEATITDDLERAFDYELWNYIRK